MPYDGRLSRRRFLQNLCLAGLSSGALAAIAACGQPVVPTDPGENAEPTPAPATPDPAGATGATGWTGRGGEPASFPAVTQPATCFPETGKCVQGLFYAYWHEHGGLERFGYPITDEFDEVGRADGKTRRVQYFERARLEYHPERVNTPAVVLPGLLGREHFAARYPEGQQPAATPPGSGRCFPETGHCIAGAIARHWERTGGLAAHGYPVSGEFDEVGADGKGYRVQYFERTRLELHAGEQVAVGHLGREHSAARYPEGQPAARTTPAINVWAGTTGKLDPRVAHFPTRVYVPHERGHVVEVINPDTFKVIDRYEVGIIPHHITPAWDLSRLYIDNTDSGSLGEVDPLTGKVVRNIPIDVPYNLYFTPDGSKAVVAAEPYNRLDFYDPRSWELIKRLPINGSGVDHMDFSADGRYLLVSCEFDGQVFKVDTGRMEAVGVIWVGGLPIDIKLSPDGAVFYVANQGRHGVSIVDPVALREIGFLRTGDGAHGLAVSRDTKLLYVTNRLAGTISVIDFQTRAVVATWEIGGSPDMIQLSPGGRQLWTSGRYHNEVYVVDTRSGELIAKIPVDNGPHGLTYFPQPGRICIGHNGVYR
jgi:YVTN family beta-propeller protein